MTIYQSVLIYLANSSFHIISDGTYDYVVNLNCKCLPSIVVADKTAFEATTNHVHLVNRVSRSQYRQIKYCAEAICKLFAYKLKALFPDKVFVVSLTCTRKDSLILRFHQKWEGETFYIQPHCNYGRNTFVSVIETDKI